MKFAMQDRRQDAFSEKNRRQDSFVARASAMGMSQSQIVDSAKLFPRGIVQQCKVIRWVR